MCGYCIEGVMLTDLLDLPDDDRQRPLGPMLCAHYLQEAADWRAELSSWERGDQVAGVVVALCRIWSERIAGIIGTPLRDELDADALSELETWIATLDYSPDWQWVLGIDGCPSGPLPIALARARLDSYISEWLQRPPDVMDWDHNTLYKVFLGVSVALDIVSTQAPGDSRLEVLATSDPSLTPDFGALDLWLQRRALRTCVAQYGVGFIEANLDKLRVETILSMVTSDSLNERDLMAVQALVQGRSLRRMNIERDDLLEAIQLKLKRIA